MGARGGAPGSRDASRDHGEADTERSQGTGAGSRRRFLAGLAAAPLGVLAGVSGLARSAPTESGHLTGFAHMPQALTMATGAPGGGLALVAPRLGALAGRAGRLAIAYRASGGSIANILLIERRSAQLAIATLPVMAQAWTGDAAWTLGTALRDFRALFPLFATSLQVVIRQGGAIADAASLSGQRIGVGPAGSAGPALVPRLLAAAGIAPRLLVTGFYRDQLAHLRAGQLDACAFFGATPMPAIAAATAGTRPALRCIGFEAASIGRMRRAVPGLTAQSLPDASLFAANLLSGSPSNASPTGAAESPPGIGSATVASVAVAFCHADMPDALAAKLTETAMLHRAELLEGLPHAARATSDWLDGEIPIGVQPGAAAVLRRYGFGVPARLVRG